MESLRKLIPSVRRSSADPEKPDYNKSFVKQIAKATTKTTVPDKRLEILMSLRPMVCTHLLITISFRLHFFIAYLYQIYMLLTGGM